MTPLPKRLAALKGMAITALAMYALGGFSAVLDILRQMLAFWSSVD